MIFRFGMVLTWIRFPGKWFMECWGPGLRFISVSCIALVLLWIGLGCGVQQEQEEASPAVPSLAPTPRVAHAEPRPTPTLDQTVIAKLGDEVITYGRIRQYMDPRKAHLMSAMAGRNDLQPYLVKNLEKKINDTINLWLLLREARQLGLTVTPEEIDKQIALAKSGFANQEKFESYLRDRGLTGDRLDILIANHLLITKMQDRLTKEFSRKITPEAKQAWYEKHVDSHFSPPARSELYRVCLLYGEKRTPEEASKELRAILQTVQKRFKEVRDMTGRIEIMQDMASQYSETLDGRYTHGFQHLIHVPQAWLSVGKEYSDAVQQTPVGIVSDIVPIPSGYSFFYVTEKFPGMVHSFDHPLVQKHLPSLMLQEQYNAWRDEKRKEYGVEYYRDRLEACVASDLGQATGEVEQLRAARLSRVDQATPAMPVGSLERLEGGLRPSSP